MQDEENQKCFDCNQPNPKWASLNNAVFVCLKCAGIHRGFGINVSFIRSLTIDSWDDKQIEILQKGGNKRLRLFLEEYKVSINATLDFKYMIRATDYYRKLLKFEVSNNVELPTQPDIISGLELLDFGVNSYPRFDNSTPIQNTIEQPKQSFLGKMGGFFSKAKEQVKQTASNVSEKIKEMEIGDKLKNTGEKTWEGMKIAGSFVAEKSKNVYNSEVVQKIAHKTEEGINVIVDKTKKLIKKR